MPYRAEINEQEVPLKPDTTIAITKQINEIGDLETRQGDVSNRMQVVLDNATRVLLGLTDTPGSAEDKAYTLLEGDLFDSYTPIMLGGSARILSVEGDYANVAFYTGWGSLASLLQGKTLHDITTLNTSDHDWNHTDINASIANTNGHTYAIAQWGGFSTSNRVDIEYLHPCYYVFTLVDKLLSDIGWSFDYGTYLDTDTRDFFLSWVFPFSKANGWKHSKRFTESAAISKSIQSSQYISGTSILASETDALVSIVDYAPDSDRYTATTGVTFTNVTVKAFLSNITISNPPTNTITPKIAILKNGTTVVASQTITTGTTEYTVTASSVALSTTDYLEVVILKDATVNDAGNPPMFSFDLDTCTFYSDDITKDIAIDDNITPEAYIPDIDQITFLKGIFNMLGVIPIVDTQNKALVLRRFQDIVDNTNTSNGIDWSDKLILTPDGNKYLSKETDIGYAITNEMRYAPDDTHEIPSIGNATLTIEDTSLPPRKTLFTLPWAASERATFSGVNVAKIPFWVSDGSGGFEKGFSPKQRIAYISRENVSITFYQGGTSRFTRASDTPFLKFIDPTEAFNLGFENNLVSRNYTGYYNTINKALKLTVLLNLNSIDVANLDHFKPVYFEQFGAWFYVNKVRNYIAGEITECEIVRL